MAKYIIKRILAAIPMVLIITVICFALMNLAPYDAIDAMTTPNMSPETVALTMQKMDMISRYIFSISDGSMA